MTSRFRIALLAALATFMVVGADTATACISVGISGDPARVHVGDLVHYSVSRLGKGAQYTISFNGSVLKEGVQQEEEAPIQGTFTVPDLGSKQRQVVLSVVFDHWDVQGSQEPLTQTLTYEPTAAPPPPPGPPPPPPLPPPPPVTRVTGAVPTQAVRVRPSTTTQLRRQATPETRKRPIAAPVRATPHAPVAVTAHAPSPQRPQPRASGARRAVPVERARTPHSSVRARAPAPQVQLAPPRSVADEPPQASGARKVPYLRWVVLALGFLFVAGVNAANGWVRLRRRRTPPARDEGASLEVEAELQEIIAEEQAKRKLRSQR
jgi:hypothetical protein